MAASSSYSLEPSTKGCLRLKTTRGDLIIDLFSREAPENCKYFCQQCLDGKYKRFHRIVPDTLVQAGGDGGGTTTSSPTPAAEAAAVQLKGEFHSRLEFRGRGFVAISRDNANEFFITLKPTPWLNRKHTIVGMLRGPSVFVALKIGNSLQEDEVAIDPVVIESAQIIEQPFDGVEMRPNPVVSAAAIVLAEKEAKPIKKVKLSFGEEEEEEIDAAVALKKPPAKQLQTPAVAANMEQVQSRDARMLERLGKRGGGAEGV